MQKATLHRFLTFFIAAVWFINGLYCKILNLVPRHEEIVARILGAEYARPLTFLIGISEIVMSVWVISRYQPKLNAITQMSIVILMNVMEFFLVPDLLLWGRWNFLFALGFIGLVYYNEFRLSEKKSSTL